MGDILRKIEEIEYEMSKTQKNKATAGHLGMLKAKLAKLRRCGAPNLLKYTTHLQQFGTVLQDENSYLQGADHTQVSRWLCSSGEL